MAEVNLRSWPEISQAADGLQLNPTAVEYILAKFAQFETRLDELERRAAATLPPLRPEPDPPDEPPLYAASQPPYQPPTGWPPQPSYCQPLPHHSRYQPNDYGPPPTYELEPYHQPHLVAPQHSPYFGWDSYVQQPLLQCPPSCRHPPSCLRSATAPLPNVAAVPPLASVSRHLSRLHLHHDPSSFSHGLDDTMLALYSSPNDPVTTLSSEKKHVGDDSDLRVLNQVDLVFNMKKFASDGAMAVEVSKIYEVDEKPDQGESKKPTLLTYREGTKVQVERAISASDLKEKSFDFDALAKTSVKGVDAYPNIGVKRMRELDKKLFHDAMKRKFPLKDVYIEYAIVGYWSTKQRSFAFDPGGDNSSYCFR